MVEEKKKYTLNFNEDEIRADIAELQQDPQIKTFLDVQNGARKFEKLTKLIGLIENKQ